MSPGEGEGERREPVGGDLLGEGERREPVGGDLLGEGERREPVGGDLLGEGERREPVGGDLLGEGERREPVGGAGHGFEVAASRITHRGVLTTLRVDRVRAPDGAVVEREIAERLNAVAMVPLTAAGEVVLVRQYRHAVGRHELEIPAGLLDVDGESEETAAQRELLEEIGMTAGSLRRLLCFHNSGGWSDEATIVFLATDLREAAVDPGFEADAEEADMTVLRMPLTDAVAAVRRGEIRDAKTVIGLLLVAADGAS